MIQTSHCEIFSGNVAAHEGVRAHVPVVKVRKIRIFRAPQAKEGENCLVDSSRWVGIGGTRNLGRRASIIGRRGVGLRTQDSLPGRDGRDGHLGRDAVMLAKSFVVGKEKGLILYNRSANCPSKLVAVEEWDRTRLIKEVLGIERAVTKKLIDVAMKLVGPRFGKRIDDATGGASVFR